MIFWLGGLKGLGGLLLFGMVFLKLKYMFYKSFL
nr:MAG TPA: hypothetical protein [Caudoviricetes sp.]